MEDPVLELLNKKNIESKVSGRDYVIKCLSPKHDDSNPSLRVDKITGIMHCLACGFKGNLFTHFGVFSNYTSIKIAKLKQKLNDLTLSKNGLPPLDGAVPFVRAFRGISAETYKKFGAFYTTADEKFADRLIIPITDISDKVVVYIARHTMSDGNPRYLIHPRHVQVPVFPGMLETPGKKLVIVEGIFDFLNLYDKGMRNVACVFGTTSLKNNIKSKLLAYKVQGVEKIFILFDGDNPGREAAKELKPELEENGFQVEILHLEDGTDPGELSQEHVDSLIEYTK